jgi:hypothetical protein
MICAVALLVRLGYEWIAHTYRIRPVDDHAYFGWEMGRVARALATGRGYADPFTGETGPTAWVSPLYPLLLAGIFKTFGVYSQASAVVAVSVNCLFSALTAIPTYAIGKRCFGVRVAVWAAWIWALYPPSMQFAARSIWETSLSTLLVSCAILLALKLRGIGDQRTPGARSASTSQWLLFGALCGLLALSNPSALLFLTACGFWILCGSRFHSMGGAILAVAVCALIVSPWMLRNQRVFHRFIPMRSNAGAELYLGNGPGATGLVMEYDHPFFDAQALAQYRRLGEVEFSAQQGRAAWRVIRQSRLRFAALVVRRVYFFWCGVPHERDRSLGKAIADWLRMALFCFTSAAGILGLLLAVRSRNAAAPLLVAAFVLLPLVYYFVFVHARFRHPLEPLIAVLGVWLFQSAGKGNPRGTTA